MMVRCLLKVSAQVHAYKNTSIPRPVATDEPVVTATSATNTMAASIRRVILPAVAEVF